MLIHLTQEVTRLRNIEHYYYSQFTLNLHTFKYEEEGTPLWEELLKVKKDLKAAKLAVREYFLNLGTPLEKIEKAGY